MQFILLYFKSFLRSECNEGDEEVSMNASASGLIVIFPPKTVTAKRAKMRADWTNMLTHKANYE